MWTTGQSQKHKNLIKYSDICQKTCKKPQDIRNNTLNKINLHQKMWMVWRREGRNAHDLKQITSIKHGRNSVVAWAWLSDEVLAKAASRCVFRPVICSVNFHFLKTKLKEKIPQNKQVLKSAAEGLAENHQGKKQHMLVSMCSRL